MSFCGLPFLGKTITNESPNMVDDYEWRNKRRPVKVLIDQWDTVETPHPGRVVLHCLECVAVGRHQRAVTILTFSIRQIRTFHIFESGYASLNKIQEIIIILQNKIHFILFLKREECGSVNSGQEVVGSIPALGPHSLLVGSVSV